MDEKERARLEEEVFKKKREKLWTTPSISREEAKKLLAEGRYNELWREVIKQVFK